MILLSTEEAAIQSAQLLRFREDDVNRCEPFYKSALTTGFTIS